jgi:hypothetical protein
MDEENVALQGSWLLGTQRKEKKEKISFFLSLEIV